MFFNQISLVCLFLILCTSTLSSYEVISEKYSHYLLDIQGNVVHSNELPVPAKGMYSIPTTIDPNRTALVIMDPWIDMEDQSLNTYFGKITKTYLVPLVYRARDIGHQIIILTNAPSKAQYCSQIDQELLSMVDDDQVHLFYHQNYNAFTFASYLKSSNINTLIYTGYASNMCVIAREMGMIMMKQYGLRLFFVPEASAAVDPVKLRGNSAIHNATTRKISQWLGNLIHWKDYMETMSRQ